MVSATAQRLVQWAGQNRIDATALADLGAEKVSALTSTAVAAADITQAVEAIKDTYRRHGADKYRHLIGKAHNEAVITTSAYEVREPKVEKGELLSGNGSISDVFWSADRRELVKEVRPNYSELPLDKDAITRIRDRTLEGATELRNAGYPVTPMRAQGDNQIVTRFARGTLLFDLDPEAEKRATALGEAIIATMKRQFPHLDIDPGVANMTFTPDGRQVVEMFDPVFGFKDISFDLRNGQMVGHVMSAEEAASRAALEAKSQTAYAAPRS